MDLLRTKSVEQSIADTDEPEYQLKKSLSALDLTVFGVGVVIGAGIFTLTGRVAHTMTGPAIVNIFAAVPVMKPSVLNSSAGAATELAKPVIGTSVPAPASFAMSS